MTGNKQLFVISAMKKQPNEGRKVELIPCEPDVNCGKLNVFDMTDRTGKKVVTFEMHVKRCTKGVDCGPSTDIREGRKVVFQTQRTDPIGLMEILECDLNGEDCYHVIPEKPMSFEMSLARYCTKNKSGDGEDTCDEYDPADVIMIRDDEVVEKENEKVQKRGKLDAIKM